jgi:hypothetical protein
MRIREMDLSNNQKVVYMEDITLDNGVLMPILGLGVFQTPPDEVTVRLVSAKDERSRA